MQSSRICTLTDSADAARSKPAHFPKMASSIPEHRTKQVSWVHAVRRDSESHRLAPGKACSGKGEEEVAACAASVLAQLHLGEQDLDRCLQSHKHMGKCRTAVASSAACARSCMGCVHLPCSPRDAWLTVSPSAEQPHVVKSGNEGTGFCARAGCSTGGS